ncbi:MAG: hypothetical protein ACI9LV_000342 [Candidatus Nanohaloarchaea archaeon]|jgi:hypothetical protein
MVLENLVGLLGFGAFSAFFLSSMLLGLIEIVGKVYGTFRCLIREDLTSEQRIIYLLLIWFIPLGWLVYFLLGTERTQRLFADIDVL